MRRFEPKIGSVVKLSIVEYFIRRLSVIVYFPPYILHPLTVKNTNFYKLKITNTEIFSFSKLKLF